MKQQPKQQKLNREQEKQLLEASKQQRNLQDLQAMLNKLMRGLDELAYKIENTKSKKKKEELTKKFDKRLNLVISMQQGNFSLLTH